MTDAPVIDQLIELALDESKWFATALGVAVLAATVWILRCRKRDAPRRLQILSAMNLAYGFVILTMASGHILAVTIKAAQGTLAGSPWILYPLGLALGIPSWLLVRSAPRILENDERIRRKTVALNVVLGACLVALGLNNLVLAIPTALNIAYQVHSRRVVGLGIVAVTIIVYLALLIGSLLFLASGGSFEDFRGL